MDGYQVGIHSFSIIGTYGTGKSSFLLQLESDLNATKNHLLLTNPKVLFEGKFEILNILGDSKPLSLLLSDKLHERIDSTETNVFHLLRAYYDKLKRQNKFLFIAIDEFADLMMTAPNEVEDSICRLAQKARAAGMHLVVATQRPTVNVITGVIKANIPSRISLKVSSQLDSRTILDVGGAEKLIGRGDMLFAPIGAPKPTRVQGCYASDAEIENVTSYIKKDHSSQYNVEIEEEIERDFNHPSIIGWCPYNETWDVNGRKQDDDVIRIVYRTVKALDKTRPCIDTSGNYHVETDIYDLHNYDQDYNKFRADYEKFITDNVLFDHQGHRQEWNGAPVFMSEYGGIRVELKQADENDREKAWGYGNAATSLEEFYERYDGLTTAMIDNPKMIGFCYTQLTDVEQELNGIYRYDRSEKFDSEILYKINTKKAAIEE